MNSLDYGIVAILAFFVYRGFRKGFLSRVLGLVGAVAGIWFGIRHNAWLAKLLSDFGISPEFSTYLAMFIIFVGCILVATLIARFLRNVSVFVEIADNLLGSVLGLLQGVLVLGLLFVFLASFDFPNEKLRKESKLYVPILKATVGLYNFASNTIGDKIGLKEQIQKTIEKIKRER